MYTHADGRREVVVVVKRHSDDEGGGATIFVPSLGREKSTTDDRICGPVGGGGPGGGDGGGAGVALALVSPPLCLLLGHADGSVPPLAREERRRAKGTRYVEVDSSGARLSAPKPTGSWSLSIPTRGITARLEPPPDARTWAVVSVTKGAGTERYDFSAVAVGSAAIAACRRWRREQMKPHKYPGGTTNRDGGLKYDDPVFELSLSDDDGENVFSSCQFTLMPNSCIVQVAHLITKGGGRRRGYGTAALAAMLLGGCHLNQALFGASTNRLEVADGSDMVCACNSL